MKTISLAFASTALAVLPALLLAGLSSAAPASADDRPRDTRKHHASAHSQPAPQTQRQTPRQDTRRPRTQRQELPRAGQPNRQPNRHFPPGYYLDRPGGSALNAPSGYYRDNLSYDPPRRSHRHGDHQAPVYAPTYVVVPPLFPHDDPYRQPLAVGPVRGPEDAVEPVRDEPLDLQAVDPLATAPVHEPRAYAPRQSSGAYAPQARQAPGAASPGAASPGASRHPTDLREENKPKEPQTIGLDIVPADADVWLDDEYLGRAGELTADVVLPPGVYLLEVEHDDLPAQRLFFGVVDQPVDVRVDLGATEPRRRYRVR